MARTAAESTVEGCASSGDGWAAVDVGAAVSPDRADYHQPAFTGTPHVVTWQGVAVTNQFISKPPRD